MTEIVTSDPTILQQLTSQVNNEQTKPEITTVAPSNTEVTLPGGFIDREGSLVKYAEVRELNGLDEEAIAKSGSVSRALLVMLQRGLVSIGLEKADKGDLEELLSGDRDAILIGIRRVTFGDTIKFEVVCPSCKTELDVTVDLRTDIPVKTLEDPINDRIFTYESEKHGVISVSLPKGNTQRRLLENTDKTVAELNTILLSGCINSINGVPTMGASSVLKLGMADREKIVAEIIKRTPGPRLGEVKTSCEACGEGIPMPLALADLFRI